MAAAEAAASVKIGRRGHAAWLGIVLACGGVALSVLPSVLELDEALGLGALFGLRGPLPPPDEVVVVSISRDAAAAVGQDTELDEWPRQLHAELIDRLRDAGAAAIAFDIAFNEQREQGADSALATAIARAGNVVLLERVETDTVPLGSGGEAIIDRRILPLPELKQGALASAPFILPTVPIRVGQFWTFGRGETDTPSLPVVALQAFLLPYYDDLVEVISAARPGQVINWPLTRSELERTRDLEVGMRALRAAFTMDTALARDAAALVAQRDWPAQKSAALRALLDLYSGPSSRYLNYYGPARSVRTVPYDGVWRGSANGLVAGKMVFVGFSETRQSEQQDDFYSVFSLRTGVNLSGVEVGATAFANVLGQIDLTPLPMALHLLLVASVGLAVGTVLGGWRTRRVLAAAPLIALAYLGLSFWLFSVEHVWLPMLVPLGVQLPLAAVAAIWWTYRELIAQRERVHTALGYYVPTAVARRLAEQSVAVGSSRELLHGTCLFTDAEQYTAVAEAMSPQDLAALMNDYYRVMFDVVERYGGEISDTSGDSMVAVWASAEPDAALRERACHAALAILESIDVFNRDHGGRQLPTRIGLESGELVLGNIGAAQRYEYRAIGDIVNTASRIQGLNQLLGTRLLISSATLGDTAGIRARPVGTFLLRGKRSPVQVHEPLSAAMVVLDDRALAAFAAALAAFRGGAWADARARFGELESGLPGDGPSRYYHALARRYQSEPPTAWNGVVGVTVK